MAITITLKDFLTKEIVRNLDIKTSIAPFANKAFTGEITKQGDTVTVQTLPTIDWLKGVTAGATISQSNFVVTSENLTADKVAQINIPFADIDSIRYNRSLQADIAVRIAEGQARLVDQFVASFVRDANASNQLNETAPVTLSASNVLAQFELMRVALANQNVDTQAGNVVLFVAPSHSSFLRQGNYLGSSDLGVGIRIKGDIGQVTGMRVIETTDLPWVQSLTMDVIPTAADTLTINGVVFTYVAAGAAAAAGDIAIGANVAAAQVNTVDAINLTGTAAATTYVAVSAANRVLLDNVDAFASNFATNISNIYFNKAVTNSETFTPVTDLFGTGSLLAFAIEGGAINMVMQMTKFDTRADTQSFTNFVLGEMVYGGKVFTENAKRITTNRLI